MAISSENFCSSAINAFILVLKNAAKFAFVNTIGSVFMTIAKVCISIATTVISYFVLRTVKDVQSPYFPMALIFIFSYGIASVFISVFDVSANTILQCYLIDLDIAKQHNLEPTHVPPTLEKFLRSHMPEDPSVEEESFGKSANRNLI